MIPVGMIAMWYGSVESIPPPWHLCDGTHGTPDLRDRFIVGAGQAFDPGDTGGSETHQHTVTTYGHNHGIVAGAQIATGIDFGSTTTSTAPSGFTDSENHVPPYHSLCYIMRI